MADETTSNQPPRSARANNETAAQLEAMRKQQNRRDSRGKIVAAVLGLLLVAGIVLGGLAVVRSKQNDEAKAASGALGTVTSYGNLARDHITSGYKYQQQPPVGGAHHPVWANCGVYDKPVAQEHAVHSLEHGAVWITYTEALPAAQVEQLRAKVTAQGQGYMLMSPNPKQTAALVLTAWGKQLRLKSLDTAKVDSFIQDFLKGPQTPEPGAACSGGYDPNTGQIPGQ